MFDIAYRTSELSYNKCCRHPCSDVATLQAQLQADIRAQLQQDVADIHAQLQQDVATLQAQLQADIQAQFSAGFEQVKPYIFTSQLMLNTDRQADRSTKSKPE